MLSFEDFEGFSETYNVIPLTQSFMADLHTPVSVYVSLRGFGSHSFLFESVDPNEKIGRFSFVGIDPSVIVKSRGKLIEVWKNGQKTERTGSIFDTLAALASKYREANIPQITRFSGGFVGYLGYDCVQHLEQIPVHGAKSTDEKDAIFGLFNSIVQFDHRRQLVTILHNVILDPTRSLRDQYEDGRKRVAMLELRLRSGTVSIPAFSCDPSRSGVGTDKETFCEAVARAKRYIREGDIFQVVLSRKITLPFSGDPFPVYRALRFINPSPYLFYVDYGETKLIGSSPEVLVRVKDGEVEVLPIAGTRQRGRTEQEDRRLEADLLADAKELAEHVMLVDLGRNDVGRISDYGSVRVPVFTRVERYSHVMHLVSEVRGRLKPGVTALDALKACFPAGTVSGAPKVRAMEIIHELEPVRRGVYAGAVGYLGLNGTLDTCIAIRTIVVHKEMLSIQAGAGIVADSIPEKEYQETVNKAQALLDAVTLAANGLASVDDDRSGERATI